MASVEVSRIRRKYVKERRARREAEALLGQRSIELYQAGRQIREVLELLESEQPIETTELRAAHDRLAREVEARKDTERKLLENLDTLGHALRSQNEVLLKLSRSLAEPLEGMLPYLAELLASNLDDEQLADMEVLKKTVVKLLRLVSGFVEYSAIGSGEFSLQNKAFEAVTILRDVVNSQHLEALEEGIQLELHAQNDEHLHLLGRPKQLRKVMEILVENAVHESKRSTVQAHVKVTRLDEQRGRLWVAVEDSGAGLDLAGVRALEESLAEQSDESASAELAIANRILERMGDRLRVRSEPGKGTALWFKLDLPQLLASSGEEDNAAELLAGKRVLLLAGSRAETEELRSAVCHFDVDLEARTAPKELLEALRMAYWQGSPFHVVMLSTHLEGYNPDAIANSIRAVPELASTAILPFAAAQKRAELLESLLGVLAVDES